MGKCLSRKKCYERMYRIEVAELNEESVEPR
jgi:hypothetical protein